jgi:hypothetical protein
VLGSLDPAERADVDARRKSDAALAGAIVAWERRLGPLSDDVPVVEPSTHLLTGILSRISSQRGLPVRSAEVIPMRAKPRRWQPNAIGAGALAACLTLAIGWPMYLQSGRPTTLVTGMDCSRLYKDFWGKLDRHKYEQVSAERLVAVSRMALRAYDACQAGDEPDANVLFHRLERVEF